MKLTEPMKRVLREISEPGLGLPPTKTTMALVRRGLVRAVDDPSDVISQMIGAYRLELTDTGRAALAAEGGET